MRDNEMEQAIAERGLNAPRITTDHINAMMGRVIYSAPNFNHTSTFVHAFLDGKFFIATGHSACVSIENFDPELGERFARDDAEQKARNRLWELEGYALYARSAVPVDLATKLSHLGGLRGVALIAEERKRQIEDECCEPRHDDGYRHDELVRAAVAYASYQRSGITLPDSLWPWHLDWWKPRDQKANLVRAGALIAAELDRLLRAEAGTDEGQQALFGSTEVASGSGA